MKTKLNYSTKVCICALAAGFIFGACTQCNRYDEPDLMSIRAHAAVVYDIPEVDTAFKSYMDYHCITNTRSAQYRLQKEAVTDENGLRMVNDCYCVALGTYYSSTVGDIFEVTLDSGESFRVIVGDIKADKDTDSKSMYHVLPSGKGDMIEFIVDSSKLPKNVRRSGTIGTLEKFSGNVTKIEKVEE